MNVNLADYAAVLTHPHDGCQYEPTEQRGALLTDAHFQRTRAVAVAGVNIPYRLCAACARLPKFLTPYRVMRQAGPK